MVGGWVQPLARLVSRWNFQWQLPTQWWKWTGGSGGTAVTTLLPYFAFVLVHGSKKYRNCMVRSHYQLACWWHEMVVPASAGPLLPLCLLQLQYRHSKWCMCTCRQGQGGICFPLPWKTEKAEYFGGLQTVTPFQKLITQHKSLLCCVLVSHLTATISLPYQLIINNAPPTTGQS